MDRATEGTRARFNATFRENCPLLTLAQFGFWGATSRNLISAAPSSIPSPAEKAGGQAGLHPLLSPQLPPHTREVHFRNSATVPSLPRPPTIFGFRSGVTGAVGHGSWTRRT